MKVRVKVSVLVKAEREVEIDTDEVKNELSEVLWEAVRRVPNEPLMSPGWKIVKGGRLRASDVHVVDGCGLRGT